jgi:hypothetical protein
MRNIRLEMAAYREAVRHLWNSAFSTLDDPLRFGACLDLFEQVDDIIFLALVCEPIGIELEERASFDPILSLKVIITSHTEIPVMINRLIPASGYWDHHITSLSVSDIDLAFISYFDWDAYNQKDLRYYRVRIVDSKSQPDLIGRDALIETFYADVFWDGEGLPDGADPSD